MEKFRTTRLHVNAIITAVSYGHWLWWPCFSTLSQD